MAKSHATSRPASPPGAAHAPSPDHPRFGAPPLIAGEPVAAYEEFAARIADAVAPADVLEEMWMQDVIDLAWEVTRLRRLKARLMHAAAPEGVEKLLERFMGWVDARELAARWGARDGDAVATVARSLAAAGLTVDDIMAQTLAVRLRDIERIDRMIMFAEGRRDGVLREVDRHRASLAKALRHASRDAEDGAAALSPPQPGDPGIGPSRPAPFGHAA